MNYHNSVVESLKESSTIQNLKLTGIVVFKEIIKVPGILKILEIHVFFIIKHLIKKKFSASKSQKWKIL